MVVEIAVGVGVTDKRVPESSLEVPVFTGIQAYPTGKHITQRCTQVYRIISRRATNHEILVLTKF